jgi:DNA gyrase/topoisomerase IV subunit B
MARGLRERYGERARLDDCRDARAGSAAELFIVEGESAAAAVVRVRDAAFQAVLPMQGKPLNAARAARQKVLAHPLFGPLIDALGTGLEPECRADACRYGRILLLMDPDAEVIHSTCVAPATRRTTGVAPGDVAMMIGFLDSLGPA